MNDCKWKIIGQTRNSRPIYEDPMHPEFLELGAGYNAADHIDAYYLHMKIASEEMNPAKSALRMKHAMDHKAHAEEYENNFVKSLINLKDKLLKADDDEEDLQDYGLSQEELDKLNVTDDPFADEEDDASKWLAEQEGGQEGGKDDPKKVAASTPVSSSPKKSRSLYTEWQPRTDYEAHHAEEIKRLTDEGYTPREAERLAGAHKGPSDFQSALTHTVKPSQPSEKMLGQLKELAGEWLGNARKYGRKTADPSKNPDKYISGQLAQRDEDLYGGFNEAYNKFLGSPEVKDLKGRERFKAVRDWKNNLKGRERFKAVRDWKNKWHQDNPEYHEKIAQHSVSDKISGAQEARKKHIDEIMSHIASGGQSGPVETSMEEAAQHVGGVKTDQGHQASTIKDPVVSFAQQNPELVRMLKEKGTPEQLDRFHRISSAKASSPSIKVRKKPEEPPAPGGMDPNANKPNT